MGTLIHPTAVITPGAQLGTDVDIGPYSVIGASVSIGDRTRLGPHVLVEGVTRIGADNVIVGQANLGGPPQDLTYNDEPTELVVGDGNTIREFVTVNRGTVKGGGITKIGSNGLLMACCHVAHDCELGDRVILANGVLLAGHVLVGDGANISGGSAAHHFVTIGAFAYVGGLTRINVDVPPFMVYEGRPARVRGVNVVGLRRAGFEEDTIEGLWQAFRRLYRSGEPRRRCLKALSEDPHGSKLTGDLVASLERTELGLKGRHRESLRAEFERQGRARMAAGVS